MLKVTIDLNIILEVFLERSDNKVCGRILRLCELREIEGNLPSHGITTIFYLLRRGGLSAAEALSIIDDLNRILIIAPLDNAIVRIARTLPINDFEDAVVAASAMERHSDFIVTRNLKDFTTSSIPPITPSEFIRKFDQVKDSVPEKE